MPVSSGTNYVGLQAGQSTLPIREETDYICDHDQGSTNRIVRPLTATLVPSIRDGPREWRDVPAALTVFVLPLREDDVAIRADPVSTVAPQSSLDGLPPDGWRFFAVAPRIRGMATFPVRAFALVGRSTRGERHIGQLVKSPRPRPRRSAVAMASFDHALRDRGQQWGPAPDG